MKNFWTYEVTFIVIACICFYFVMPDKPEAANDVGTGAATFVTDEIELKIWEERDIHEAFSITVHNGSKELVMDYNLPANTLELNCGKDEFIRRLFYAMNYIGDPNEYLMNAEIVVKVEE